MSILLYDLTGRDPMRPFSPHCWKAAMALAHKGLAFERVPVAFTQVAGVEDGAHGIVPVIRDGDKVVADSFEIARYLEEAYPQRPSLFGGEGGEAAARFVERWTIQALHSILGQAVLLDIHAMLLPEDQAHFRRTREIRFGKRLEEVPGDRPARVETLRTALEPLRATLQFQSFLGGTGPLFTDYIVFGAFQWARVVSPLRLLAEDDPVRLWLERCLDLHQGLGRSVAAAA